MGDRLRKQGRRLLAAAWDAALPALVIFVTVLLSLQVRGILEENRIPLRTAVILLLLCYLTAYPIMLILHGDSYGTAQRVDASLIGNAFGSFSKRDKSFCKGLEYYAAASPHMALEHFLDVRDHYTLTEREKGICAFYIGRCYQLISCPSNAISNYREAYEKGFPEAESLLFLARSYCESGAFDESYDVYMDMLDRDLPAEFGYVYTDLGFLFLKQNQPEEAIPWFQKSIAKQMNFPYALGGLSVAMLQQGKFRKAKQYLTLAVTNRMPQARLFRQYFSEVQQSLLNEHPDWDAVNGSERPAE